MVASSRRSNIMNAYNDISLKTEEVLQIELEVLKQEHRDLDAVSYTHLRAHET